MNFKCADRHVPDWPKPRPPPPARGDRGRKTPIALALATLLLAQTAAADPPRRVVSINLCTDQLLLALAEPGQIAGLGRFSRHAEMSFLATRAADFPSVRGAAEEVMRLRPDLVLAGAFSGRATRQVLAAHGLRIETFAPPRSVAEAKAEVARAAGLIGQPERGATLIAEIDAAATEAAVASRARPPITALALQRRGFASGTETLLSSAMAAAGLSNAAAKLGIGSVAHAPLEAIIKLAPDVLVVEDLAVARDQSTVVLHHPALARAYPPQRLIALPVAELTCGGPSLPALIRRLSRRLTPLRG